MLDTISEDVRSRSITDAAGLRKAMGTEEVFRRMRDRTGGLPQIDAGAVLRKRLSITGSTLRPRTVAYKTELARDLRAKVWPLLESGRNDV